MLGVGSLFPTVSGGSRTLPEGTPASASRSVEGEGCQGAEQTLPCPRTSPEGALQAGTLRPGPGNDIIPKPAGFAWPGSLQRAQGACSPEQCMCRRGRSNSYFCNGFERCYAPCPLKGEAAGKGSAFLRGMGCGEGRWSSS